MGRGSVLNLFVLVGKFEFCGQVVELLLFLLQRDQYLSQKVV